MDEGAIRIGGVTVLPGKRATVELEIPRLSTHTDITMPVSIVNGARPGPRLFVCSTIHGDEINGMEIIRRLLKETALDRLSGALVAIPIVNIYGFLNHSRYLPDRRDMNRFFPGSDRGSLASQIAHLFMEEIVSVSTHGIDLHSGSDHRTNLPQIRAHLDGDEVERLAAAFGAPVVVDAKPREGSLRTAVGELGKPVLLYEAGESFRFDEESIRIGVRGILAVMRAIGMLPAAGPGVVVPRSLVSRYTTWTRAPKSGILTSEAGLGERVSEGDVLGVVADPFGEEEEPILSPLTGLVIGKRNLPLVHKGDAIYHVASLESA